MPYIVRCFNAIYPDGVQPAQYERAIRVLIAQPSPSTVTAESPTPTNGPKLEQPAPAEPAVNGTATTPVAGTAEA